MKSFNHYLELAVCVYEKALVPKIWSNILLHSIANVLEIVMLAKTGGKKKKAPGDSTLHHIQVQ